MDCHGIYMDIFHESLRKNITIFDPLYFNRMKPNLKPISYEL